MFKNLLKIPQKGIKRVLVQKKWKIYTGDTVQVVRGVEKGKRGKIYRFHRKTERIWVEGVNQKAQILEYDSHKGDKGETKLFTQPLHYSQVHLIDPDLNIPVKIKIGYLEDGTKVRISKKTGNIIEKPSFEHLTYKVRNANKIDGPLDTLPEKTHEITYKGEDFAQVRKDFDEFIKDKESIEENLVFED